MCIYRANNIAQYMELMQFYGDVPPFPVGNAPPGTLSPDEPRSDESLSPREGLAVHEAR